MHPPKRRFVDEGSIGRLLQNPQSGDFSCHTNWPPNAYFYYYLLDMVPRLINRRSK